jgi:AraC-like DNA-binding protein
MNMPTYSFAMNPFPGEGELTSLFAGHSQTEPLHQAGPQVLDYYLVHMVISGKGRFRCRGKEYELGKGNHFFIFPGELVSYISDQYDPWSYRWIACKGTHIVQLLSQLGISPHNPVVYTEPSRKAAALFYQIEHVLREGHAYCHIQAEGYLRLLLGEYGKRALDHPPQQTAVSPQQLQMEQAILWLTLQYNKTISIEQMAYDLGYHRTYLSRIFKAYTGLAPMHYLLRLRMERAKLLLREKLTIEQVASSVGFTDALYFSKQFKKWSGLSPSEYRMRQQKPPLTAAAKIESPVKKGLQ